MFQPDQVGLSYQLQMKYSFDPGFPLLIYLKSRNLADYLYWD